MYKAEEIITTIDKLTQQVIIFHSDKPSDKPPCPRGCRGNTHWHGSYHRYLCGPNQGYPRLKVFRVICAKCGKTKSCLHPYILKYAQSLLPLVIGFYVLLDIFRWSMNHAVKKLWHSNRSYLGYYWLKKRGRVISLCNHLYDSEYQDRGRNFARVLKFMIDGRPVQMIPQSFGNYA